MQFPKGPASEWTIEDAIQFITVTDPALSVHADLFRKHVNLKKKKTKKCNLVLTLNTFLYFIQEIDGKALLLLNSDMMMKYMDLKLGPALKICNIVNRLNSRRHSSL